MFWEQEIRRFKSSLPDNLGETMVSNKITNTYISLGKLKSFCKDYDEKYGSRPENEYEGDAVFNYILGRLEEESALSYKDFKGKENG